jgi:hypothetical protein
MQHDEWAVKPLIKKPKQSHAEFAILILLHCTYLGLAKSNQRPSIQGE